MLQGYISLHRCIQENKLWKIKPFSKGQAWIDLLILANYKDNEFLLGNETVNVLAGSFITSQLKLSERWGWSRHKVNDFLLLLQSETMLVLKTDNRKTTLTIVNYSMYQDHETEKDSKRTPKGQLKDTNNKVNKVNKKDYAENVAMTEENYNKLIELYGGAKVNNIISAISDWKFNSKNYHKSKTENDFSRASQWIKKDLKETTPEKKTKDFNYNS